jgi:hypothetical protein
VKSQKQVIKTGEIKVKILHLTLKKQWFDMILNGQKKEEYREIKPYWRSRLGIGYLNPIHTHIKFRNGYRKNAPELLIELKGIKKGLGKSQLGAPKERVYILELGEIISTKNI